MNGWAQFRSDGSWHQVSAIRATENPRYVEIELACGRHINRNRRALYVERDAIMDYRWAPPRQCRNPGCQRKVEP